MLTFNLKKQWFEKIANGEKTIEFREVKPFWTTRLLHNNCLPESNKPWIYDNIQRDVEGIVLPVECDLVLGYTKNKMSAIVSKIEYLESGKDTDLAIDKPVYAIHLSNIQQKF